MERRRTPTRVLDRNVGHRDPLRDGGLARTFAQPDTLDFALVQKAFMPPLPPATPAPDPRAIPVAPPAAGAATPVQSGDAPD